MASANVVSLIAIAVAVASLALVTATAVAVARPDFRNAIGLGPSSAYVLGSHIDVSEGVYASSPYTLVIFARSGCAVCRRSVPVLARFVQESRAAGVSVRLLSAEPVTDDELAFGRAIGLTAAELVGANLKNLRLKSVPTVVLVDRAGEIHYAREGAIPAVEQEDLLRKLTSLTR